MILQNIYIQKSKQKGFTLIELIVSLGIFGIIMLLVTSTYFVLIAASTDVRTSTGAINNVTFAFDTMADDIRTGTCKSGQCLAGSTFTFTDSTGDDITYSSCTINNNHQICESINGGNPIAMTYAPVSIKKINFNAYKYSYSSVANSLNVAQTFTIISVNGNYILPHSNQPTHFYMETAATPRRIHIQ